MNQFCTSYPRKGDRVPKETWFIFSDVKSAFDTISREAVYNVLTNGGVSAHLMQLLKDCLTNITAYVRSSSLKSDKFK